MPDIMEVQILKQSMGDVGLVGKYNFNGPTCLCQMLEDQQEEE
jgi:hypothetical protein